jgi:hypothetical protein
MKINKKIEKTDGYGNIYLVENPDFYDEDGNFRKYRNPMTHLKPKKKKRK